MRVWERSLRLQIRRAGVGMLNKFSKTTSVVHLGAALKMSGRKVLLIDFDPQRAKGSLLQGKLKDWHGIQNVCRGS